MTGLARKLSAALLVQSGHAQLGSGGSMKTMTCLQLGGACAEKFQAATFDEIAALAKKHGMAMFLKGDAAHLKAIAGMRQRMSDPKAMKDWMDAKRREFDALPPA
jgi:hypothetical protein